MLVVGYEHGSTLHKHYATLLLISIDGTKIIIQ